MGFVSGPLEHYVGSLRGKSDLLPLRIFDGRVTIGNKVQYIPALCDVSCSAISSDGLFVTIGSSAGYLRNYFVSETGPTPSLIQISRTLSPGTEFSTCAISSHYGLVCAATDKDLCLYDMTTGYLLRYCQTDGIKFIQFDEVHDLIIVASESELFVLGLDFRDITSISIPKTITSICAGDASRWKETPMFMTGHSDGSLSIWEVDMMANYLTDCALTKWPVLHEPITAVVLFQANLAVIACDAEGSLILVSTNNIKTKLLDISYFDRCGFCSMAFKSSADAAFCSRCGVPCCKNNSCYAEKQRMCIPCSNAEDLNMNMDDVLKNRRMSMFMKATNIVGTDVHRAAHRGQSTFKPRMSMAQIMTNGAPPTSLSETMLQEISIRGRFTSDDGQWSMEDGTDQEEMPVPQKRARRITFGDL